MKPPLLALMLFASTALATDLPRVYVEATETVDASNAKQFDFGVAITAALVKKKVPVLVVTDKSMAQWTIKATSNQKTAGTKLKLFGGLISGEATNILFFEGAVQVIDNESTAVIYAFNVRKMHFKKAAQKFAGAFKDKFLKK